MDVKNEKDFEIFYRNKYKKQLDNFYNKMKKDKIRIIITGLILCLIYIIISLLLFNNYIIIYIICSLLVTFFFILCSLKSLVIKFKKGIIKDIIAFTSDNTIYNILYNPKNQLSKNSFNEMNLFNLNKVKYSGKNYMKIPYHNNAMIFSDISTYVYDTNVTKQEIEKDGKKYIRTTKKKVKKIIFDGMYIGATLNKPNSNHIYLIPNNVKEIYNNSKFCNYSGHKINLENLDFSKKYKVFCDDEIDARYILSLGLMERINDLDDLFPGKKYIVFKKGKRFTICIEGLSIEKIMKFNLSINRNEYDEYNEIKNVFNNINNLFKIYYILDLGNPLYSKEKIEFNDHGYKPAIKSNTPNKREILLSNFDVPKNIKDLDCNKILRERIEDIKKTLDTLRIDNNDYELSKRQVVTKQNVINRVIAKDFLDAFFELEDYVDDYGNRHNGRIYRTEKEDILSLLDLINKNMKNE